MTCDQLAYRLQQLRPELSACDIARLCVLILTTCPDLGQLETDEGLDKAWRNASFRLDAASDQHAAVADELASMCDDGPIQFSPDQLWTLLRAVKVQSQILELYTDQPALA
ncbi:MULTISPECIES: hypothetical protein [Crateriforma]|uniref:Uncharacterized protein n=1 Tax=Crateriforma conspicua TaxID=2527996 RepID=A0A5C6FUL8_9PLAN|nr:MULTISPECIES: hypothetical protein [Crateriforma]TWU66762.1 hypothetical protein V7x_23330 [Crateriforma conspicua]